jgi:Protein of unknown function (DUF3631)
MPPEDRDADASVSERIRLLAGCRAAFAEADALPTTILVTRLRSDPEAPWCDHGPAGITPCGWPPCSATTTSGPPTSASLSRSDASIELIARLVGHTTTTTEAVYRHEPQPVITEGAEIIGGL